MFEDFDRVLPRDSLKLIHLNDSKTEFASHKDQHECIGKGHIWKESQLGLVQLCQVAKSRDIPVVLETTEKDFEVLYSLVNKL